ncbi:TK protein kinase [Salpingoeca rosetta]|uniref:non-specific protein-tyrosine kinase n=1 Tax=Salpingoeca rosetta (strain ATCC 50818 / BSB-021) TaxID=946362 RepID=F2TVW2_SALR5|nr:TK protein kinase [Salpingoeca rosetta]EGD72208.1 TK protein kinase [Salpingoeca rosetta]|eukprot:XP_004998779.1 TK protein kinase [Salpingoeca rosetta]
MADDSTVLLDGMMLKRSLGKKAIGPKKWTDRYFVMTESTLYYYTSPSKDKLKGTIDLASVRGVEEVMPEAFSRPYMFQLIRDDHTLYCQCQSILDQRRWLEGLRRRASKNPHLLSKFHKGVVTSGKWTCCGGAKDCEGCGPCFDYGVFEVTATNGTQQQQQQQQQTAVTAATQQQQLQQQPAAPAIPAVAQDSLTPCQFKVVAMFPFHALEPTDLSLSPGEELEVLDASQEHWWRARNSKGEAGMIPANYVRKPGIESEPWFLGRISRTEAGARLRIKEKDGYFLVRESETRPGTYSLTLLYKGSCRHYHIKTTSEGLYYITERHQFKSINELITYHKHNSGGLATRLKFPLLEEEQPSAPGLGSDKWQIALADLSFGQQLGAGQFGVVYKGVYKGQHTVAIKTMKQGSMNEEEFVAEAEVMKHFKHRNLVELLGIVVGDDRVMIVTEFMENGCLLNYLRENPTLVEKPSTLLYMSIQCACAMAFLESHGFIHRDLAARNCLVGQNYLVKVADFGLARYTTDDEYTASEGTKFPIKWAAPEVFEFARFSSKSDVWSFGILLWEIWSGGVHPYPDLSNAQVVTFLNEGKRLKSPAKCPDHIYSIMTQCWHKDVEGRPNFAELYKELCENKGYYTDDFPDVDS